MIIQTIKEDICIMCVVYGINSTVDCDESIAGRLIALGHAKLTSDPNFYGNHTEPVEYR